MPRAKVTLTITLNEDGTMTITGPQEKGILYSLLELARDAIKDQYDANAKTVIPATDLPPSRFSHGARGN